ncbi:MAG: hypothetical protein M1812_001218 [Candelaria pacifica]|nr:MAG: hypothetical protein M1812_001218 [Candelaria pacifica]
MISRAFLFGLNRTEVKGLDGFLDLLDRRRDVEGRKRGLITVSNHVSILDDPLIWGTLPLSYQWSPNDLRWSLGAHDILFKNNFGQTLPTRRLAYSPHGGPFQPTMVQTIRLLSEGPFFHTHHPPSTADRSLSSPDITDPFSSPHLTFSTDGVDTFPAPSAYRSRRHSWVHVFSEGKVHQSREKSIRYFKWGVARLILEAEPMPDIVPMWIEGTDQIMHESRQFPRFVPRPLKDVSVTFGEQVDTEKTFGDLRRQWKALRSKDENASAEGKELEVGILPDWLKYGKEAVELRKECTRRIREEVLKVRRQRGLPDEDPKAGLVETWRREGNAREGKMEDGTWVRDV